MFRNGVKMGNANKKCLKNLQFLKLKTTFVAAIRGIAQPGRVRVWGACGRKFESCCPDYRKSIDNRKIVNAFFIKHYGRYIRSLFCWKDEDKRYFGRIK